MTTISISIEFANDNDFFLKKHLQLMIFLYFCIMFDLSKFDKFDSFLTKALKIVFKVSLIFFLLYLVGFFVSRIIVCNFL